MRFWLIAAFELLRGAVYDRCRFGAAEWRAPIIAPVFAGLAA